MSLSKRLPLAGHAIFVLDLQVLPRWKILWVITRGLLRLCKNATRGQKVKLDTMRPLEQTFIMVLVAHGCTQLARCCWWMARDVVPVGYSMERCGRGPWRWMWLVVGCEAESLRCRTASIILFVSFFKRFRMSCSSSVVRLLDFDTPVHPPSSSRRRGAAPTNKPLLPVAREGSCILASNTQLLGRHLTQNEFTHKCLQKKKILFECFLYASASSAMAFRCTSIWSSSKIVKTPSVPSTRPTSSSRPRKSDPKTDPKHVMAVRTA